MQLVLTSHGSLPRQKMHNPATIANELIRKRESLMGVKVLKDISLPICNIVGVVP